MGARATFAEYRDLKQKALNGAHLLDERRPGWALRVKIGKLNLRECDRCVLGQEYGNYTTGTAALGIDGRYYGFNVPGHSICLFPALTQIWRQIIRRWRQAERSAEKAKASV